MVRKTGRLLKPQSLLWLTIQGVVTVNSFSKSTLTSASEIHHISGYNKLLLRIFGDSMSW